jgi:uncharacterized protein (TIGR00661 family)
MAKILFSLAPEGRGHSSRSYEIIKRLADKRHKITVLTGGDSYEPLEEGLKGRPNVKLVKIGGFRFTYTSSGKLSYPRTFSKNISLLSSARNIVKSIEDLIDRERFDFAIVDCEPFVPRAAKRKGLPFITFDNQHRFVYERQSLKDVSKKHLVSYFLTKESIRHFHPMSDKCVITSSFAPELDYKKFEGKLEVFVVGPIIRSEIEALKKRVRREDFVLVYVKRPLEKAIIPKLQGLDQRFVMFVKEPKDHVKSKNITYKRQSLVEFAEYLSRCKAVISSAGEQLMSEALFLGKPMFLLPEHGTYEQKLNAELVKKNEVGDSEDITSVKREQIQRFLSNLPLYEENIRKMHVKNGISDMMKIISAEIKRASK